MSEVEKPEQSDQPATTRGALVKLSGLRLMPVGLALALTAGTALVLLTAVIVGGLVLLGVTGLKPEAQVSAATLFDLLKIAFAVVAGLGGLVALVVAYRRQKVAEAAQQLAEAAHALDQEGEQRAHRAEQREATKLHNDRFATAAGQLGHDSPAVQLAGVHALAGLADDAPTRELRQTCIDVLCAYLRMPYAPEPGKDADQADRLAFARLREVRHTIIRLIAAHLRDSSTVSWEGHDLDFTGVVFDGGDFTDTRFSGGKVSFFNAKFSSGVVFFVDAEFSGSMVDFVGAEFSGGTVHFIDAEFSGGTVRFNGAEFSGGTVLFTSAEFSGSKVFFTGAEFSGSKVFFTGAEFSGGIVNLEHASSWAVPPTGLPTPPPAGLLLPPAAKRAAVEDAGTSNLKETPHEPDRERPDVAG